MYLDPYATLNSLHTYEISNHMQTIDANPLSIFLNHFYAFMSKGDY